MVTWAVLNLRRLTSKLATLSAAAILLLALVPSPSEATWSIVGVDPETGEVGVAVASCVPAAVLGDLDKPLGLVALAPGKGAGISQALLNNDVPPRMVDLLNEEGTSAEVLAEVTSPEFDSDPQQRQHGVVTSDGVAAGFTGSENMTVALDRQGPNVTAQGNILVSEAVVVDAVAAFGADADAPLAERLVNALVAGAAAGGDSRCGDQTALFAQVVVAGPNDDPQSPTVLLLTTVNEGDGSNPVTLLADLYRGGTITGSVLAEEPSRLPVLVGGGLILGLLAFFVVRRLRKRASNPLPN